MKQRWTKKATPLMNWMNQYLKELQKWTESEQCKWSCK